MSETAVVVLVPEAAFLDAWRRLYTSDGRAGMTPHVTLLYPFADDSVVAQRVERVGAVLSSFEPFDCVFIETARFVDDGVLYLRPEADEIFRGMTEALTEAFPDFPPYGGVYDDVVPHLTVAQSADGALLDDIERDVRSRLPIETRVSAAAVMHLVDGRWQGRTTVPLG